MHPLLESLALIWAATAVLMTLLWLVQRKTGNAGIVDVGWSFAVGAAAVAVALALDGDPLRRLAAGALGGFWGLRLAWHIHHRSHGKPEDGRYRQLREEWAGQVQLKMLRFYQYQAISVPLFAFPFAWAAFSPEPFGRVTDWLGIALALVALGGEAMADAQLHAFKSNADNKGKVCQAGWWRYSRHPNYFFEWLNWCAFALLAATSPVGLLAVLCPIAMLLLLTRVTGIPATEEQAVRSKGEAYRAYQRTTSPFIPWFPRKREG